MRKVNPIQHKTKRDSILDAAERCFARYGLRVATIAAICAEAEISPGHLYHYFKGKEAILGAICERLLQGATEQFGRTLEKPYHLADLLSEAQRVKLQNGKDSHILILDMIAEAGRNPGIAAILQEHSRRMRQLLITSLRKGQAAGEINPTLDAELSSAILIALIDGAKTMTLRDASLDRNAAFDLLRSLIECFLEPPK